MSDRPLCECHGEVMQKDGDRFRCAVYAANREKVRERKRRHYEANREKELERKRRYREANREKVREQQRRYREANREKVLERKRASKARRYYDLQLRGLCTTCGKEPLLSESRCWDCLNKHEEGRFVSAL